MKRIYLDNAATTSCHPAVVLAMQPYFAEKYGNPSSLHHFGQEARAAVESAREKLANLIGARPEEIVFCASGTEANNFALHGVLLANENKGNHIITSAVEHHAILEPCGFLKKHGYAITILPVDKYGLVDPDEVKRAITEKTILVSIMHANNEIGTIEPIAEIAGISHEKGVLFHTDAVQTVGQIEINVDALGVDLLSLSGHKFYGPKGAGALYIRKGTRILPFIRGGAQERNRRASTENVPGIIGMGAAAELAQKELLTRTAHLSKLQNKLIKGIFDKVPEVILNGHPEKRLAKNVNISFRYIEGESILLNLDMEGIAASTGSACSSGTLDPSHVLMAIGLSHEIAHGSIRFSLGIFNTEAEIDYLLEVLPKIICKLRQMSPLYKK
ncbi:MAG: cysteine desulfurase NifS [Candidatus Margulisbacteria bacterium]|nr:cysteine desulfurase NifS [Candidatus Margulisiibacteriota bacterium]